MNDKNNNTKIKMTKKILCCAIAGAIFVLLGVLEWKQCHIFSGWNTLPFWSQFLYRRCGPKRCH